MRLKRRRTSANEQVDQKKVNKFDERRTSGDKTGKRRTDEATSSDGDDDIRVRFRLDLLRGFSDQSVDVLVRRSDVAIVRMRDWRCSVSHFRRIRKKAKIETKMQSALAFSPFARISVRRLRNTP